MIIPAETPEPARLKRRALESIEALTGPEQGYNEAQAEEFDEYPNRETAQSLRRFIDAAQAAAAGVRPETARLPEWRAALTLIQEDGKAAVAAEHAVVGDDQEHTEELEGRFRHVQLMTTQAEANVRQVIAFLEGQETESQAG